MQNIEEYRVKVREIADLAFAKAIDSPEFSQPLMEDFNNADFKSRFIAKVHEGFKKAQDLLIIEIDYYQKELREKKEQLKEFRRLKDKHNRSKTDEDIKIIIQRLATFSHIADGIAWQIMGGAIHIARRFHIEEDSPKFLDSSNIEHAKKVADEINQNPLAFALISDITSYVQIGDLLIKHEGMLGIMELKEGSVNDQIKEFIDELEKNNKPITDEVIDDKFDKKTAKQAKRMQRQNLRMKRVTEVINTDKGTDPVSEKQIKIFTPKICTERYGDVLMEMAETLNNKIWAYEVIENCLHIGMYKDKGIIMAGTVIQELLKTETDNYIIIDWLSITHNLSEPIFSKPFPPSFIVDILTGKIKIIIGLNIDKLIEFFNLLGLQTKWLNRKETTRLKQTSSRKGMFVMNNKGISMKIDDKKDKNLILYGGIISKILYDNILPSNIALSILSTEQETE